MTIVRAADLAPQDLRSLPIADLRQQMRRDREESRLTEGESGVQHPAAGGKSTAAHPVTERA